MSQRRVVVTGLGIVSSIGNNKTEVTAALRAGQSGIEFCQEYADLGFRSHIHGPIRLDLAEHIDRKLLRFMGDGAAFNYLAMAEAIADAGLEENEVSNIRDGLGRSFYIQYCPGCGYSAREGVKTGWPLHGDPHHVEHQLRLPGYTL